MFCSVDIWINGCISYQYYGFWHLQKFCCRYKAVGIRLDSGDLAYLSVETRKFFHTIEKEFGVVGFGKMSITASNDLNEETIDALNKQVIYNSEYLFRMVCGIIVCRIVSFEMAWTFHIFGV